jgi:hypothetical protein
VDEDSFGSLDPDPNRGRKNNFAKIKKYHVWKCWMPAGGFSCSLKPLMEALK